MIILRNQNTKYGEALKRLLEGEKLERYLGIIALNTFLIGRLELFTIAKHLPKRKPKESTQEYYQRWIKNFDEKQKLVIEFIGAWQSQILVTLLKIYQAGILLSNPISEEERLKRKLKHELEWYELIFPLFLNEIYAFIERLKGWLKEFLRALRDHDGPRELITQLKTACKSIEEDEELNKWLEQRHYYVHTRRDKNFENYLRSLNVMLVISENLPGGERHVKESFRKQSEEIKADAPKLAIIVKRKLLSILNRYSGFLTQTIKFLIPGFTSISLP